MRDFFITFVTRPGCHLCDDAAGMVERVGRRLRVGVRTVNLEDDDDLIRLYSLRIPVVLGPDGSLLAEGVIDERELRRTVRRRKRA